MDMTAPIRICKPFLRFYKDSRRCATETAVAPFSFHILPCISALACRATIWNCRSGSSLDGPLWLHSKWLRYSKVCLASEPLLVEPSANCYLVLRSSVEYCLNFSDNINLLQRDNCMGSSLYICILSG
jgi:hypothetical protein